MPFYAGLKKLSDDIRKRTVDGLLVLRNDLVQNVPNRTVADTLLLATWNIREFDLEKYGFRCDECLYFIAEIIDHFDMVAIQEVRSDLTALKRVMEILGKWWDVIYTDVTYGASGNGERMAILFDKRKVRFDGLAGEVVLPETKRKKETVIPRQLARSPFICGFQSGWIKFDLCTVHTYYGTSKPNEPRRLKEIDDLSALLSSNAASGNSPNTILVGDFNIFKRSDDTFKALLKNGFIVPDPLMKLKGSNVKQDKEYDQIAFLDRKKRFTVKKAGVFNFYKSVFSDNDENIWVETMGDNYNKSKSPTKYYKDWRTYQMSDHFPLWVELVINHSEEYLCYVKEGAKKNTP